MGLDEVYLLFERLMHCVESLCGISILKNSILILHIDIHCRLFRSSLQHSNVDFSLCNGPSFFLLYCGVADCFTGIRLLYPGLDDTHYCTAYGADYFGTFLFLIRYLEGTYVQNQLQKPDEFLAARMKKAVISGYAYVFHRLDF